MLKFFYRLTRRKGVVLFAVIAIMTLLIAMASTAYFTARSSYKTVVSNYNFSQMYLAATSVSDMMIAAATQDSQYTGTSAEEGKNFFKNLKEEIQKLKTKKPLSQEPDTKAIEDCEGSLVVISDYAYTHATGNKNSDILKVAADSPVEDGILDAVKVVIALEEKLTHDDLPSITEGLTNYYFSFTTTAFYKNNTITVQDIIYNQAGKVEKPGDSGDPPNFNSFFTATGQEIGADGEKDKGSRAVIIDTDEISDKSYFQSRTTVFLSGTRPNKFLGGVTASGGLYLCGQTRTAVPAPTDNERHDWFIGGDFAILNDNTEFDLNGNNLYVKGDLIIATQNPIKAGNIFVEGNVIVLNGKFPATLTGDPKSTTEPTKSGGLFVGGKVIAGNPGSVNLSDSWDLRNATWGTVKQMIDGIKSAVDLAKNRSGGSFSYAGYSADATWGSFSNGWELHGTLYQGAGGTVSGWTSGSVPSANPGTYDPNTITVPVPIQTPQDHTYVKSVSTMTVSELFDTSNAGSPIREYPFPNYTAKQPTYDNLLEIDFSQVDIDAWDAWTWNLLGTQATIEFETTHGQFVEGTKDNSGNMTFTFHAENGKEVTVEQRGNNGPIDIKIPWCKEGYRLYIKDRATPWGSGFPFNGNGEKRFLFETKASTFKTETVEGVTRTVVDEDNTMPIVLMGNFDDGSSKLKDGSGDPIKDSDGADIYNSFSWMAKNYNGSDCDDWVLLTDDTFEGSAPGNVIFEMANVEKSGSTGKYVTYDFATTKDAIVYYTSQREGVCTWDQKEKMQETASQPWENKSAVTSMLQPGTSDPYDDYEDRVMLVSNQNMNTAVNAFRKGSIFCGYIYAPNGSYYNYGDGKIPVFGGLIVSDYAAIDATYIYCEPDPLIVKELLGSLDDDENEDDDDDDDDDGTPEGGNWYTGSDQIMGRNYLG